MFFKDRKFQKYDRVTWLNKTGEVKDVSLKDKYGLVIEFEDGEEITFALDGSHPDVEMPSLKKVMLV